MDLKLIKLFLLSFLIPTFLQSGEFDLSCDLFNRYVWRGQDFGQSPSIQPGFSYTNGIITIGAWSAWSFNGDISGNENDIYFSINHKNFSATITDYFFPTNTKSDDYFNYSKNGPHILEVSTTLTLDKLDLLTAVNVMGDNSIYTEIGYSFKSNYEPKIILGIGNGMYSLKNDWAPVEIGLEVTKKLFTAKYMINPNLQTNFLIFGYSL